MEFNPEVSFEENLATFKLALEECDAELSAILFANLDVLSGEDAGRDREAIRRFNVAISAALSSLSRERMS